MRDVAFYNRFWERVRTADVNDPGMVSLHAKNGGNLLSSSAREDRQEFLRLHDINVRRIREEMNEPSQ